ncbi:MAG: sigma 54-interacting transcriptional regulator [bacterium]
MPLSSPQVSFDGRLLSLEGLFRQRQYNAALQELADLSESEFSEKEHEHGLFLLLKAEGSYFEGNYRKALQSGLRAAKLLADFPLNRRYGWTQLVLSKSYSAMGDLKNAEIRARDALASFRRASDPVGQVNSLNELARISSIRSEYRAGVSFLTEAVSKVGDNPRKVSQLLGNTGTLLICTGRWKQAEKDLTEALKYNTEHNHEVSKVINLLSLGYLRLRRRQFILARRDLDNALEIISRLGLKREKILYLKFAGELALERGDMFRAKTLLSEAYQQGLVLAPASSLVSQAGRRLAEAELALDNIDDAMKYGQKALEMSLALGEKVEIGLSYRVIAQVYGAHDEHEEALQNIRQAIEILREVADPYDLGRTLLTMAEICMAIPQEDQQGIRAALDEAHRLFRKLKADYWVARTDFKAGILACRHGDLAHGFKKLNRAEKAFASLDEKVKVRAVHKFLQSLSEQAVALSISQENEYKIFGSLITPAELSDFESGAMEEILGILLRRTGGSRALLYAPGDDKTPVINSFSMSDQRARRFCENFSNLLGQEISRTKPTLILDCRRDPFLNDLFPDVPDVVASVVVVPFKMSDDTVCYLYLDRISRDNGLNPFSQENLNFAVGFSDLIAFKWAEIQKRELAEDNRRLRDQLKEEAAFPNIVTQSGELLEMLSRVRQVVNANISISIEGETGTGKDLLVRAIHFNSDRRDKRLISVNCAALPETLLESELFGFKRGAFTGADRDKPGLFEEADGGTFFLDEIADMPLGIQAKILRVLEQQEIVRLGETVSRKVDVRVISATNKDLKEQMEAGLFRQDLYYRMTALTFRLPPLRERRADIPLLVSHFLNGTGRRVSAEVMRLLTAYDWPGNIRELENEVKKLVLLAGDSEEIDSSVLSGKVLATTDDNGNGSAVSSQVTEHLQFSQEYSLYDYLAGLEKQHIIKALREKNGIKKHAAAVLNIPESTLRLKIKQYDIDIRGSVS